MRLVLSGLLLALGAAFGQGEVDPRSIPAVEAKFQAREAETSLQCVVRPIKPALDFSFRFQAGYIVTVPMSQYTGAGHGWVILTRITPEAGNRHPLYLATSLRLPEVPKTKVQLEVGGSYLTGMGRYRVDWVLLDDTGRACRKSWRFEARPHRNEQHAKFRIEPSTVSALSFPAVKDASRDSGQRPMRQITVLLHCAPLSPRMTRVGPYDRVVMLGALTSLLEQISAQSVRLVVFNLDQQKEIFRQDVLNPDAFPRVAEAMRQLDLGLIDYKVLQNQNGGVDLLARLINRELRAAEPPDAVIFLGPAARSYPDSPGPTLAGVPEGVSLFYLQFKAVTFRGSEFPDVIQTLLRKLRGKTIPLRSPGDFSHAIAEIEAKSGRAN